MPVVAAEAGQGPGQGEGWLHPDEPAEAPWRMPPRPYVWHDVVFWARAAKDWVLGR